MAEIQRVAIVTGGNRGLGFETSRQLARLGIQVLLTSRDASKGEQAAAQLQQEGLAVIAYPLDVTDAQQIQHLAQGVGDRYGRLDILVNNAGILLDPPGQDSVFETNLDRIRTAMETNLYAPLQLCQVLVPLMRRHGYGRIVNVSSGIGQLSGMDQMSGSYPSYRLSKTALNALTRMVAHELKGTGILVNSVCPGWVKTDMGGANAARSPEEGVAGIVWAATLPDDGPTSGFFRDGQPLEW